MDEPPQAGTWGGRPPYYRVELRDYVAFDPALDINSFARQCLAEIRHDMVEHRPKYYPFSTYGSGLRLVQGIYLARCTPRIFELFRSALISTGPNTTPLTYSAEIGRSKLNPAPKLYEPLI